MDAKALVSEYYGLEGFPNVEFMDKILHKDLDLQWHSSKGFLSLDKNDLMALAGELKKSYSSSRVDISHMIQENNFVTVRYAHYVHAFENPNEEMLLAHFVAIWEVKDGQLYKGYLMSQLG